ERLRAHDGKDRKRGECCGPKHRQLCRPAPWPERTACKLVATACKPEDARDDERACDQPTAAGQTQELRALRRRSTTIGRSVRFGRGVRGHERQACGAALPVR